MTPVQQLVSNNKLKEAIRYLIDRGIDSAIGYSSRLSNLERQVMLGTMSRSDELMQRAQLVEAVLHDDPDKRANISLITEIAPWHQGTSKLLEIANTFKRSNKDLYEAALELRQNYLDYDLQNNNPAYDPDKAYVGSLNKAYQGLLNAVETFKRQERKATIRTIYDLIKEDVPSWDNLKQAYDLCVGEGFNDPNAARIVDKRPESTRAQLSVVTAIESFLRSIQ